MFYEFTIPVTNRLFHLPTPEFQAVEIGACIWLQKATTSTADKFATRFRAIFEGQEWPVQQTALINFGHIVSTRSQQELYKEFILMLRQQGISAVDQLVKEVDEKKAGSARQFNYKYLVAVAQSLPQELFELYLTFLTIKQKELCAQDQHIKDVTRTTHSYTNQSLFRMRWHELELAPLSEGAEQWEMYDEVVATYVATAYKGDVDRYKESPQLAYNIRAAIRGVNQALGAENLMLHVVTKGKVATHEDMMAEAKRLHEVSCTLSGGSFEYQIISTEFMDRPVFGANQSFVTEQGAVNAPQEERPVLGVAEDHQEEQSSADQMHKTRRAVFVYTYSAPIDRAAISRIEARIKTDKYSELDAASVQRIQQTKRALNNPVLAGALVANHLNHPSNYSLMSTNPHFEDFLSINFDRVIAARFRQLFRECKERTKIYFTKHFPFIQRRREFFVKFFVLFERVHKLNPYFEMAQNTRAYKGLIKTLPFLKRITTAARENAVLRAASSAEALSSDECKEFAETLEETVAHLLPNAGGTMLVQTFHRVQDLVGAAVQDTGLRDQLSTHIICLRVQISEAMKGLKNILLRYRLTIETCANCLSDVERYKHDPVRARIRGSRTDYYLSQDTSSDESSNGNSYYKTRCQGLNAKYNTPEWMPILVLSKQVRDEIGAMTQEQAEQLDHSKLYEQIDNIEPTVELENLTRRKLEQIFRTV